MNILRDVLPDSDRAVLVKKVLGDLRCLFAFGFGSGLVPIAPGTLGTIVSIPLYLLLSTFLSLPFYIMAFLTLFFIGVFVCDYSEGYLGQKDPPGIVLDEMVGYLITMTAVPVSLETILLGFILFRIFDIVKPWPICWVDRTVDGGLGIMLDDVVAGLFSACLMQSLFSILHTRPV